MNRRDFLRNTGVSALVAPFAVAGTNLLGQGPGRGAALSSNAPPGRGAGDWTPLFNGRDLTGFYTFLQRAGKNSEVGKKMVTVENGMLHILGMDATDDQIDSGYLATNEEYENVRIRVEYKWGTKRFVPRLENKRDNGVLYYLVGQDRVWPTCLECQIQETDVGDYFLLGGTRCVQGQLPGFGGSGALPQPGSGQPLTFPGAAPAGAPTAAAAPGGRAGAAPPPAAGASPAAATAAAPGRGRGAGPEPTGGRKLKDGDFENRDEWNTVEIIAAGERSAHLVNGRIVNNVSRIQQPDPQNPGQFIPLTKGKLALEIEFAEVWIRRFDVMKWAAT